jgi:hypothetical protein
VTGGSTVLNQVNIDPSQRERLSLALLRHVACNEVTAGFAQKATSLDRALTKRELCIELATADHEVAADAPPCGFRELRFVRIDGVVRQGSAAR